MTVVLIKLSDMVTNYWYVLALPVMVYIPIGICIVAGMAEYHGWQVMMQSFFGRWFVRWHTPDVLRALSQSVGQGVPINEALVPIIKYAGPIHLRKRLARAVDAMEGGVGNWQALQAAGLLNYHETVVLDVAQRTGNTSWVLSSLAQSLERRRMFRIRALIEVLQPMFLLPIGFVVGFVAIAIFMPLIKLLNDLS